MVEYWNDEDSVADFVQHYTLDGNEIEDEGKYLNEQEKEYFINVCKEILNDYDNSKYSNYR